MKVFLVLTLLICSTTLLALESADYHILNGSLHKGGNAKIEITEKSKKKFVAKMSYELIKKLLIPIPSKILKGETIISLPPEFKDQRGYVKLAKLGSMEIDQANLKFIKMTTWNNKSGVYDILILPKNKKSKIEVFYHPSVPAAGWSKVIITFISPYPILNGYNAVIELN
jgi:hypothetical protein